MELLARDVVDAKILYICKGRLEKRLKDRDQPGISKHINKNKLGKSPELKIVASEESFRGKVSYVFALLLLLLDHLFMNCVSAGHSF